MKPEETIFDIVPIPFFPYSPGFWAWVSLATVSILVTSIILRLRARASHKPKTLDAYVVLQSELERIRGRIIQGEQDPALFQRASLLIKRYLAVSLEQDLPSLAPKELKILSEKSSRSSLKEILQGLFELDNIKYQEKIDSTSANKLLERILSLMKGYHQEELSA